MSLWPRQVEGMVSKHSALLLLLLATNAQYVSSHNLPLQGSTENIQERMASLDEQHILGAICEMKHCSGTALLKRALCRAQFCPTVLTQMAEPDKSEMKRSALRSMPSLIKCAEAYCGSINDGDSFRTCYLDHCVQPKEETNNVEVQRNDKMENMDEALSQRAESLTRLRDQLVKKAFDNIAVDNSRLGGTEHIDGKSPQAKPIACHNRCRTLFRLLSLNYNQCVMKTCLDSSDDVDHDLDLKPAADFDPKFELANRPPSKRYTSAVLDYCATKCRDLGAKSSACYKGCKASF